MLEFLSRTAILSLMIFNTCVSSLGRKNIAESEFLRNLSPSPIVAVSKTKKINKVRDCIDYISHAKQETNATRRREGDQESYSDL